MRSGFRAIMVMMWILEVVSGVMLHSALAPTLEAQVDHADFRPALSRAIDEAERNNLAGMRRKFEEQVFDNLNSYSCDVLLPGSEKCNVYIYNGVESLKNFVVWDYGKGKTRAAAEQLFVELVDNIKHAMPSGWVGQERQQSDLGSRTLREFTASAKSDGSSIGGPILTIEATRPGELYRVTVQLNAHHSNEP